LSFPSRRSRSATNFPRSRSGVSHASITVNRDLLHILRDGRWIVTGHFIQTATNLATGKSLAIKSGGPLGVVFHDDGSLTFINHGSILWSIFPEDVDGPGLVVYTGHVVIELSPDGFATSVSRVPHQRDICAALA
jgi:hypothetical protein